MLRTNYGYYLPTASDKYHQSTKIIIESNDGSLITINYKAADKFRFLVGAGLTLRNIVFEAIDSVINPD